MILEQIIILIVALLIVIAIYISQPTDRKEKNIKVIINPEDADGVLDSKEKKLLKEADGRLMLLVLDGEMNHDASWSIDEASIDIRKFDSIIIDISHVKNPGTSTALEIDECIKNLIKDDKKLLIVYSESETMNLLQSLKHIPGDRILKKRKQAIALAINDNNNKPTAN